MFSSRIPANLAPNRLSRQLADARRAGRPLIDLTESNPTRADFSYPADLLTPLGDPRGLTYAPEPFGMLQARDAVVNDFKRRGVSIDRDQVALAASTSEAYSLIFKLLCDPGDEVLVPRPSYPLFEHLTRLDSVVPAWYDLDYHTRWTVDIGSLEAAWTPRTRGVLIVNPNNPTGNRVSAAELDQIVAVCRRSGAAIISDEVFTDYPLGDRSPAGGAVISRRDVLGFTLGGLSKTVGLPQVKLAWAVVSGAEADGARARLELACDTYLSVSTPVQVSAAQLLERGTTVREQIQGRIRANYEVLKTLATRTPACRVLHSEAGWYGIVQVPSLMSEEDLVLSLLAEDSVLVHPGYFFDFPGESFLIVSLLVPPAPFVEGLTRIFTRFDQQPY